MKTYKVKIEPLTWTNDFRTIQDNITCKRLDPKKLIKKYYSKEVDGITKSPGSFYVNCKDYGSFEIKFEEVTA